MNFKATLFILTILSGSTALGQAKHVVTHSEITALKNRMISGQATFDITDSLFTAYRKAPFDVEGYHSTTSLLWALFDRADEMSGSCKLCNERKDSVQAISERETAAEEEKQYLKVIAAADKYYSQKDYANALKYYTRATNFKSSDPYPKAKIEEITQQLSAGQSTNQLSGEELQFHNLVLIGDYLFNEKLYSSAQEYYLMASGLKSDDPHLNRKMKENDALLKLEKHD